MKKNKILFFLIFTSINIFAQEINFSKERLKYFQLINNAELEICKGNFSNAISNYDSAVHLVSRPEYRDLYNLAICNTKIGNSKVADSLFVFLLSKANNMFSIRQCIDTINNPIIKEPQVQVDGENLDTILKKIFDDDQLANRARNQNMEVYANVLIGNAKKIMLLAQKVDNLLILDVNGYLFLPIAHFFQTRGLSERVRTDSIFRKQWYDYQFLANGEFDSIGFYDFIKQQVAKGNFDRYKLASFIAYNGVDFGEPISQFNEYIIIGSPENLCVDKLQSINSNRELFGLESYEDFFTKSRFTDSLLTEGNAFSAVPFDKYIEMVSSFNDKCIFKLAKNYRFMFKYNDPADAKKTYENELRNICNKKDTIK